MAPRMQTDYHSAEETNRYSRRILKRGEKNFSQLNYVNASNVNGKEDFFRRLGLQMKRFQCPYSTLHGVQQNNKDRAQSDGLKLRNCSVVVLGATCNICGKCFKCETDVNVHVALRHNSGNTEPVSIARQHKKDNDEVFHSVSEYCSCTTTVTDNNSATKLRRKLRLIFRIGDEIVTETTVKRKHLKSNKTISMTTQTEPADTTKLIIENRSCEGDVPGIDHPVFDNSPCQCCTATVRVGNGTNQYIAGNFVENNGTESEEIARRNDRLTSTRESSIFPTHAVPFKSNEVVTNVKENNLVLHMDARIITCPLKASSFADTKTLASMDPILETGKKYEDLRYTESRKATSKTINHTVDSVTFTFQSHSKEDGVSETLRSCYAEKSLQTSGGGNTVQLVMPVILPIILPHQTSRTVANQHPPSSIQEQDQKTCFVDEQMSDDEVQEVLRIVRGYDNVAREINHESPNRFEQEMLARDVIKDMLRMEQQGWHLLERQDIDSARKRKRTSMKFDTWNDAVDEIAKKKTKSIGAENNIVKTIGNERNIPKELFARVQKSSHEKLSIAENAKENVLTCNGNIGIPSETLLQQYGVNYYTDVCEINNNTETTVQEPVGCLFIPRSAGIENIGNRPTVIDLVNDADE